MKSPRRVGIVGYGQLGRHLYAALNGSPDWQVVFVWNRSPIDTEPGSPGPPAELVLQHLDEAAQRHPDIVVEVAHPCITCQYAVRFVEFADYMIGSPTALADAQLLDRLTSAALTSGHTVYVPSGALWGADDIRKMDQLGTLQSLRVTMRKHPSAFRVSDPGLASALRTAVDAPVTLYEGPVGPLCPRAPHNVNTMAAAAVAAPSLGFDGVTGRLVADPSLLDWHVVEVDVYGPTPRGADGDDTYQFHVSTVRRNPAARGAVTGQATFTAFHASLMRAAGRPPGVQLC